MQFPFTAPVSGKFDVVGFGTNAVDHLVRVPMYPAFNSKVELTQFAEAPGGEVASTMVGLSRLGFSTAYIGKFGGDHAGRLGLSSLIDEGVNVSATETVADARTQIAYIIIDGTSGERTVIWHRDRMLAYGADAVPFETALSGRVLHLTPHDTAACIRLASAARERGIIVSIDIDNIFDGVRELLPVVDICTASSDLPAKMFGITEPAAGLQKIVTEFGCPVVGMTLGDQGSLFLCNGEYVETPGFPVPGGCIDTTGAGDAFRAGFLAGFLRGEDIGESALIANAVASLKCRALGARTSLPNTDELTKMLKKD